MTMRRLFQLPALIATCALVLFALPTALYAGGDTSAGAVYTMTNAPSGNAVAVFSRSKDGSLTPAGTFPTGGAGTGGGLGNQGGLVLDRHDHWLFAVNPGSDDLSVFAVHESGLVLTDKQPTGGATPISVSVHRDLVYVLNAGSDTVSGLRVTHDGKLQPIADSTRALSGSGTDAAQLSFSTDGEQLVVTEKATSKILIYPVHENGLLGAATVYLSPTPTPFGFAFGKHDQFFVSEAAGGLPGLSSVSSYQLDQGGIAHLVTTSAMTHQTAACWVAVTNNGRFAYTSNTGSGTLSGFAIRPDGRLELLDADGKTADTGAGSAPIDLALSRNSRFLYSLNAGNGTLSAFRVGKGGSLSPVATLPGIPAGANGLAAR